VTAATDIPAPLQWSIDHHPSDRAIEAVRNELIAYNIATAAIDAQRNLAVFLHDAHGQLRGGIVGTIWGQCLEITSLWVHPSLRGQGYGSRLLQTLEQEARAQQCSSAILNTYSFQAPAFYQRLGYEVFGMIDGYPQGYQKVFLKKRLVPHGR
jgi:ribosomal protein S18 acetylase RimI-like enzyme